MRKLVCLLVIGLVATVTQANNVASTHFIGNSAGQGWFDQSDGTNISYEGGYGSVVDSTLLYGGGYAVLNGSGGLYVYDSNGNLQYTNGGFTNATSVAGLENGGWIVGASDGNWWVASDNVASSLSAHAGYTNVVDVAGLSGGGYAVLNSNGQYWVFDSAGSNTYYNAGFVNATSIDGLENGGWIIGSSDGNWWVASDNVASSLSAHAGYTNVIDVTGLSGGGYAVLNSNSQYWVFDSAGSNIYYSAGFTNATTVDGINDTDGGWIIGSSDGNVWVASDNIASSWDKVYAGYGNVTTVSGTVPVPEPATIGLLSIGIVSLIRKR